jgi:anti-anti-sigma factor
MNVNLVIFELHGDLTLESGRGSLAIIKSNVKAKTHTILLDLEHIGFVDSAGLAMFIQLCKFTLELGIQLVLCSISAQMAQLLQLTSTESLFEIFDSRMSFYQNWLEEFPEEATIPALEDIPTVTIHAE